MPSQPPSSTPSIAKHPEQRQGKKLLDQVRESLHVKHYSYRTEETYVEWIRRFILFHGKRHPKDMGGSEIEAFIAHLAVERHVATATHTVLVVGARGTKS